MTLGILGWFLVFGLVLRINAPNYFKDQRRPLDFLATVMLRGIHLIHCFAMRDV